MTSVEVTAPTAESAPGMLDRFIDRLNPILVREVQQALSGRAFQLMLGLSTFAVVALGLGFAWFGRDGDENGRGAFVACLACLAPLVLFLLPMQAFASMRQEMTGGSADQLSLTRLTPLRIVLGKIGAGLAQFLVFLAVFAPVMALTFLLRGVDVPTIAVVLLFAALSSLGANSLCIAIAPVGRTRAIQQLLQGLTALGLMTVTFTVMVGSYEIVREIPWLLRGGDSTKALVSMIVTYVLGIGLAALIGTAALAHPHENRSTAFRIFAACAVPLSALWVWYVADATDLREAGPITAAVMALLLAPFFLWAAAEEAPLSPRVRTLVPRQPWTILAVPFLPGGQRGLIFTWILAVMSLGIVWLLPALAGESPRKADMDRAIAAWSYALIFAAITRALRSRFGPGTRRSFLAFTLGAVTIGLGCVLPFGIELVTTGDMSGHWSWVHALNPFFTIDEMNRHPDVAGALGVAAAITVLLLSFDAARGVREVTAAAAARRRLARAG